MNRICNLFDIKFPIIQGGMVWCSGWKLASAVSNSGGLGLIGAGSMNAELLLKHINKTKATTNKPFGVNIPLLFSEADSMMKVILDEGVKIVFTSAGNPSIWTKILQNNGITVVHITSNTKFAQKAQDAGVDAIVAEGFEAGGHNGREETTTMSLIPLIKSVITKPLIAAGGISSGSSMLAAIALGAEGVQIGTRFAVSEESSAHLDFKNLILDANEGSTFLGLKKLSPVRLLKNKFSLEIENAENEGANFEKLSQILGKGRAKKGMFEGNLIDGELEIGQVSAQINKIQTVNEIFDEIISQYNFSLKNISNNYFNI